MENRNLRIALAGNPNSGKTTMFNALTGSNQFVGNWPGVTVEKKEGRLKRHEGVTVVDLPGIYSLSPYTLEEVVARDFLVDERPDVILNIVDGTNLERNLYLTTQLIELCIPVVVAINMMDVVRKKGDVLDTAELSRALSCPVFEVSALKNTGTAEAAEAAVLAAKRGRAAPMRRFSGAVEHALAHIEEAALHDMEPSRQRWFAVKIFERDTRVQSKLKLDGQLLAHIEADIAAAEKECDDDAESIIANERYNYVTSVTRTCYRKKDEGALTVSDKIDRVVTNRFMAIPIFAAVMFLVYYVSVTTVGAIATDFTNDVLFGKWILPTLADLTSGWWPWLSALVVDGIVGGVGAVLGFLPQMFVLFIFLAFLEACGYMARIAFVLDRLFRKFGLSGKSFIPLLVGVGCSVPGIMASRTIENERDRRMTVITTPFIPCGAKLPLIALISGIIFGRESAWIATLAFFIGIAAVVVSGLILKKTKLFSGDPAPFIMELPAYHMPTPVHVLRSCWERSWSFVKKAGTVILLSTVLLWFLQSFGFEGGSFGMVEDLGRSLISYLGRPLGVLFAPLGWASFRLWKPAVASVTGLIAKENIVASFALLYGFAEISESGTEMWANLALELSAPAALSFLIFNLLCAPCFAAIGAIRREMNSARWTLFAVGYQTLFAYAASFTVYWFGVLLTGGFEVRMLPFLILAAALVCGTVYLAVRPVKGSRKPQKAKK